MIGGSLFRNPGDAAGRAGARTQALQECRGQATQDGPPVKHRRRSPERGVALVVVLVFSSVMLAVMTVLIYMITVGTQMSGSHKQYKTALEAGFGGADILYQIIALRGNTADTNTFLASLNSQGLNAAITTPGTCTGTTAGMPYTDLRTKIMASTTGWSAPCNQSLILDAAQTATYDLRFKLGSYTVYAKIADTVAGNTGGDYALTNTGVVSSGGELPVQSFPSQYTIEVEAENTAVASPERAKLSILYQY